MHGFAMIQSMVHLSIPHDLIEELERLGYAFKSVFPHKFFDRFLFYKDDVEVHVLFNGTHYGAVEKKNQRVLKSNQKYNC